MRFSRTWAVKSHDDLCTVKVQLDKRGKETGTFFIEFKDGRSQLGTYKPLPQKKRKRKFSHPTLLALGVASGCVLQTLLIKFIH